VVSDCNAIQGWFAIIGFCGIAPDTKAFSYVLRDGMNNVAVFPETVIRMVATSFCGKGMFLSLTMLPSITTKNPQLLVTIYGTSMESCAKPKYYLCSQCKSCFIFMNV
jgi:hypothetical protein